MEVVACWPGAGSPATPCCVPSHTISARRPGPRTVLRPLTMAADAPSDSAARRRRAPEASPTEAAPPQRGATAMAKGGAPSPSWWAGALGENGGDKDTAGGLGSGGGGQGQVAQQWRRGRAAWAAARPHPFPPLPTLPPPPPPPPPSPQAFARRRGRRRLPGHPGSGAMRHPRCRRAGRPAPVRRRVRLHCGPASGQADAVGDAAVFLQLCPGGVGATGRGAAPRGGAGSGWAGPGAMRRQSRHEGCGGGGGGGGLW